MSDFNLDIGGNDSPRENFFLLRISPPPHRQTRAPSKAVVARILTPTRPQVRWRRVLGIASGPVQCCGVNLVPEILFRRPLHSCPVVVVDDDLSKLQCCPSPWRLPAPGAWRETSPTRAKIAGLDVQASRWTLHSGDKVQPAWAFLLRPDKCPAGASET